MSSILDASSTPSSPRPPLPIPQPPPLGSFVPFRPHSRGWARHLYRYRS